MSTLITLDDMLVHRERSERWAHVRSEPGETRDDVAGYRVARAVTKLRAPTLDGAPTSWYALPWCEAVYYGTGAMASTRHLYGASYTMQSWDATWRPSFDRGMTDAGADADVLRRERHERRLARWGGAWARWTADTRRV